MEKLKKPFLFFLAFLLMMGLIGFTTHVFADDENTEIQTSTEVYRLYWHIYKLCIENTKASSRLQHV